MRASRSGWSRLLAASIWILGIAGVAPVACSSFPFPPGYVDGPVLGVPPTCEGDAYLAVPSSDCPASACPQAVAFAVCNGSVFSGCTCEQPPGVLIPALDSAKDSSFFADECTFCEDGFTGVGDGDAADGPSDGAFFDVGDRGDCSGDVAKKIPGTECGPCSGTIAYLLCDGLFFSRCACELPPGYTLLPGGSTDSGAKDAHKDVRHDTSMPDVGGDAHDASPETLAE